MLNIIFIPTLGIIGAAISTALSYFFMTIFIYYKSNQWMPINYQWSLIIKQGLVTLFFSLIVLNINLSSIDAFIVSTFYYIILFFIGFKSIIIKIFRQIFVYG